MITRSVRFHDVPAIHRLAMDPAAHAIEPTALDASHSALHLAVAAAWQDVNQSVFTYISRDDVGLLAAVQATARSGGDSWDLVRLLLRPDADAAPHSVDEAVEALLSAVGARGGVRTFARVAVEGDGQELLGRQGFRCYAGEYTLLRDGLDVTPSPAPRGLEFRPRRPADAWDIFQLYCASAPAATRHAEGLSAKRWGAGSGVSSFVARLRRPREVVLVDDGLVVGWAQLTPRRGDGGVQRLTMLMQPRAVEALPALLAHAAIVLEAKIDCPTVCTVRSYEETLYNGMIDVGFAPLYEHALLVKHSAAHVAAKPFRPALRVQHTSQPAVGVPMTAGTQRRLFAVSSRGLEHPLHVHEDN